MRRLLAAVLITLAATPAAARVRLLSYDPADDATRHAAGDLTFQIREQLIFMTVLNVRSTDGPATADLKPVNEGSLGRGGLSRLIGRSAPERDLYEVEPAEQGLEMIQAFCPGSKRAWLAFGRISVSSPLRIRVIGDDPAGGPARLCRTLDFSFQGEWRLPSGPGVPLRDLKKPSYGPMS